MKIKTLILLIILLLQLFLIYNLVSFNISDNLTSSQRNKAFDFMTGISSYPESTDQIEILSENISEKCNGKKYCMIKKFEQYTFDIIEYERGYEFHKPDEIISNGIGDCKNKAILFSSFLLAIDIPNYMVFQENHLCIKYYFNGWKDFNCFKNDLQSVHKVN